MNNEELVTCLAKLRSGDLTAFEKIYNDLKTPVYTIIIRIMRDEILAEDILQEVFIKLYRFPPAEDVRNPRAYLFQIAHNLAVDGAKRQTSDTSLDQIQDTIQAPEQDLHLKLDVELAMQALSDVDSQIVTLHINGGLKFREVAKILEMPLGTVLWRYQKAISELRLKLSGGAI